MAGNSTSSSGLMTVTVDQSNGPRPETVALVVCLPLLVFVVLVPLVGYIIHRKLKHISCSEHLPKMEGARQQTPDSHYIAAPALVTPSTVQNPIYENVHRGFQDVSPKRQYNPATSVMPRYVHFYTNINFAVMNLRWLTSVTFSKHRFYLGLPGNCIYTAH